MAAAGSEVEVQYDVATVQDALDIDQVLLQHFFKHEPMGVRLGGNPDTDIGPWISKYTKPVLEQGVTMKATIDGKIVGVLVSHIDHKDQSINDLKFANCIEGKDNHQWAVMDVLSKVYEVNFYDKYDVEKVLNMAFLTVDGNYGGRRIGETLAKKAEEHILKNFPDVKLMHVETTGVASAAIFRKRGFQSISSVVYDNYEDKNGAKIFQNLGPHKACIGWIKKL